MAYLTKNIQIKNFSLSLKILLQKGSRKRHVEVLVGPPGVIILYKWMFYFNKRAKGIYHFDLVETCAELHRDYLIIKLLMNQQSRISK